MGNVCIGNEWLYMGVKAVDKHDKRDMVWNARRRRRPCTKYVVRNEMGILMVNLYFCQLALCLANLHILATLYIIKYVPPT